MSLATGFPWTYKTHRLLGYSVAGLSTSLVFPEADACFDVAQGLPFQMSVSNILITHAHMDHASGLPYVIAMKAMTGQTPPTIYMPESLVRPMRTIMRAWEEAESHAYQFNLVAIEIGREYPLKGTYFFKAFPTFHRVPSNGYIVYDRRKKLKPEFASLKQDALIAAKRAGHELNDYYAEPLVAFTGDTRIEFLDGDPDVARSRILVMETTYYDTAKTVANAREWGHIHLDELIPRLDSIRAEKILLIHASARYSTKQIKSILDARIPEQHKARVELFPRPM